MKGLYFSFGGALLPKSLCDDFFSLAAAATAGDGAGARELVAVPQLDAEDGDALSVVDEDMPERDADELEPC